jgi:hypothetical protein
MTYLLNKLLNNCDNIEDYGVLGKAFAIIQSFALKRFVMESNELLEMVGYMI